MKPPPLFKWAGNAYMPVMYNFYEINSGESANSFTEVSWILESFKQFDSLELVQNIVDETNSFYQYPVKNFCPSKPPPLFYGQLSCLIL